MTPVCLLEWLSAALLFFPKPSTFLKKQKRAHKEVWKTTSPENKNFSGKEKVWAHKEVYKNRIKVVWKKRRKHRG